jgi:tetratricopeptide (TPR) repeat protein
MGDPQNNGEKLAYAEALMAQGEFQKATDMMKTVVNSVNDPKQAFAVADVAMLNKDLDNAEAAYKKAITLSGAPERAQRGLDEVARLRKVSKDDVIVADELFKKNQLDGAIDRYRHAVSTNPTLADARLGLARSLEKMQKANSTMLMESAEQYHNYMSLNPNQPIKEAEKMRQNIAKLRDKAAKLAEKETKNKRG